jgi:Arc/MetJ-type ribon-helix-helix transcriptional regulator
MQVEISEEAREAIEDLVREGDFSSASEAVDAAVALLVATRGGSWTALEASLDAARKDITEGRSLLLTPQSAGLLKRRIEREGHARLAAKKQV